jgi:hypothetical protein
VAAVEARLPADRKEVRAHLTNLNISGSLWRSCKRWV